MDNSFALSANVFKLGRLEDRGYLAYHPQKKSGTAEIQTSMREKDPIGSEMDFNTSL